MIARRAAMLGAAASVFARPALGQSGLRALSDLARRAAIYATPIHEIYRRRWRETVDPANESALKLNELRHAAAPSPEAPYAVVSTAWLDLSMAPMFLTLPDMGARPYSFAVVDMFGDTIDHVSRRLYGGRSPPHVLFGPSWTNPPPSGVRAIQATTNLVRLSGRIAIDGVGDLAASRAVQARVLLETPSARNERRVLEAHELMPAGTVIPEEPLASWPEPVGDDPWDIFVVAARVLGENPVPERDAALVAAFAELRLRPGRRFDLLGFSPPERAAMLEGIEAARGEIRAAAARSIRQVGPWRYPPLHPGDFGTDGLSRAALATIDPFMPASAEAMTLYAAADQSGAPLVGSRRYQLRFSPGGPPSSRTAWSLSVGGRMVGALRRDGVESVDLPALNLNENFTVELQIHDPSDPLLDRIWQPPEIINIQ